MNLPNKLTLARVILIPFFLLSIYISFPFHYAVALLIFTIASITDALDGKIARKNNLVTNFGKFLDPLADKVLVIAALAVFVDLREVNMGAVPLIIISAREFCEMDMSHIDLMVLSACQTGLGRFNDEGPAGLVRGLKKAGAGALIVSLWNVSDEATMLFMKHLYKAMSEQNSIDIHAAFNTARLNFSLETKDVRRFNSKRMKTDRYKESYNLPRFCNSFILIDAIK